MAEYIEKSVSLLSIEHEDPALKYAIERVPAADVVEVVRCSECKYFGKELKQSKHSCLNYQLPYCLENDYCSYGERKDGEEE